MWVAGSNPSNYPPLLLKLSRFKLLLEIKKKKKNNILITTFLQVFFFQFELKILAKRKMTLIPFMNKRKSVLSQSQVNLRQSTFKFVASVNLKSQYFVNK